MTLENGVWLALFLLVSAVSLGLEWRHRKEFDKKLEAHLRGLAESWRRHGGQ